MAVYKEVRTEEDAATEQPVTTERQEYGMNVAARVVYFIGGIILVLLGLRLLLALLGANPANAFANFIYTVTRPLVAPFFGLFSSEPTLGSSHFELSTLVAIIVYAILMGILARLVTIGSRRSA